jgi:hypothetical protein
MEAAFNFWRSSGHPQCYFSTIVLATGADTFWGVGIGCFGAGFPLLTLGLLQHKKIKEHNEAGSL